MHACVQWSSYPDMHSGAEKGAVCACGDVVEVVACMPCVAVRRCLVGRVANSIYSRRFPECQCAHDTQHKCALVLAYISYGLLCIDLISESQMHITIIV